MKICFWIGNAYYRNAGTNKVVCILANELVKHHDISILTTVSQAEDSVFQYDERVTIEKVQAANFVYKKSKRSLSGFIQACIRAINNKTNFFNTPKRCETLKKAFYPSKYIMPLEKFFSEKNYDIIIATGSEILWLAVMSGSTNPNTKRFGWQHNDYQSYVNRQNVLFWKKEEILKKYIPQLDSLVVLNPYDQKAYLDHLGLNVNYIGNPLTIKSNIKTNTENKQFIFVGRISSQKGVDFLIDSFATFCEQNEDWQLIIVGDGSPKYRDSLIRKAWDKEVQDRIRFVGFTENVLKYYLQASIYLMSSRYEGWGLVVTEAMHLGLPVIAYDITPMGYLIDHHKNGIIIEKFNTQKFAVAMTDLANDIEKRTEMSQSAIRKSACFSLEVIIREWEALFNRKPSNKYNVG